MTVDIRTQSHKTLPIPGAVFKLSSSTSGGKPAMIKRNDAVGILVETSLSNQYFHMLLCAFIQNKETEWESQNRTWKLNQEKKILKT